MIVSHPYAVNQQKIEDEGIAIIEEVPGMPTGDEPFTSPDYVICIGRRGNIQLLYDDYADYSAKGVVAVIFPNHNVVKVSKSDDYMASLIVVNAAVIKDPMLQIISQLRYRFEPHPSVELDAHEFDVVMSVLNVMRETSQLNIPDKKTLMLRQLELFLRLLAYYRNSKLKEEDLNQRVGTSFLANLKKYIRTHRDVSFYARLSYLSPKYFTSLIQKETGHTAAWWIHSQVISEAKMLLHINRDLPIKTIADMLGFSDQASFSRYFKRETGKSPKDFRDGTINTVS